MQRIRQLIVDIRWLWAVWLARRFLLRPDTIFSKRTTFHMAVRPPIPSPKSKPLVMAWPDAIFHITPADVRRAIGAANSTLGPAWRPNPQDHPTGKEKS